MKTSNTLVTAGLILSVAIAGVVATANAGSMVEASLKLAALERKMTMQLRRAPALNRKIVSYALGKKGVKIGNGQCTELISSALAYAGAKPGSFADYRNYIWGQKHAEGARIYPGDIIQFEECKFKTTTTTANGGTYTSESNMDHHTAIVRYVTGSTVVLLHQNLEGSPVKQTVLNLNDKTQGRFTIWGPVLQ